MKNSQNVKFACFLVVHNVIQHLKVNETLPGPKGGGGDGDVLGLLHGAGQVIREVVAGLDRLGELDHHHGREGVPVLRVQHGLGQANTQTGKS